MKTNSTYTDAIQLNNTVTPIKAMETHKKTVNQIYLQTIINNQHISTADSITLFNIATQLPFLGGDAVYSARVILGLDPTNLNLDYINAPHQQAILSSEIENAILYPNPTSGFVNLLFNSETKVNTTFELYDINSRLIFAKLIPANTTAYNISLNDIKSGIYYFRISNNNNVLLKNKLIIYNK